ncbi:unnamed protein product [Closterium sp. Yama58-4]|nr:unnamed protein product [Closterium sp. Yama58-4]
MRRGSTFVSCSWYIIKTRSKGIPSFSDKPFMTVHPPKRMARDEIVEYRSQDVVPASPSTILKKRRLMSAASVETHATHTQSFTKYEQVCDVYKQIERQLVQEEGIRRLLDDKFGKQDLLIKELKTALVQLQNENALVNANSSESRKECMRLKRVEAELKSSLELKKREAQKYSSERDTLVKQAQASQAAYHVKEKECEELASTLMQRQVDVENYKEDMKQLELSNTSLSKEISRHQSNIKLLQTTLEHRNDEVKELKAHIDRLSAELGALDSVNALSTRNADAILSQLSSSNARLQEERFKKEELQQELHEARKECEQLQTRVQQMEQQSKEAEEKWKRTMCQLESEHGQSKERISQLLTTLQDLEARAKEAGSEREKLQNRLEALEDKDRDTTQEKEGLQAELQCLTTDLKSTKESLEAKLFMLTTENQELSAAVAAKTEAEVQLVSANETLKGNLQANEAALSQMKEQVETLEKDYKECQEKLLPSEKQAKDLKRDYQRQMQSKQLELQKHLQEISRRNNLAMAEMRKEFEAEATRSVDEERKKAQDALESAKKNLQNQLAEEKEKYGARIKSLLEKNKSQVSELEETHRASFASFVEETEIKLRLKEEECLAAIDKVESKLRSTEDLITRLKLQHSEEMVTARALMEQQHAEAIASLTEELEGRIELAKSEREEALTVQLEEMTRQSTELKEKLASMDREYQELQEVHRVNMDKLKEINDQRHSELQSRLRGMEKKCKQQQENHEGMLRNLHDELERCLAEAQEKLEKSEKKCMRLEEETKAREAQLKESYEQQIEELRQSEMRLEEECATTRVEAEGHISKLKMEHENMLNKLNMEHEDSLRKTQMEHENVIKKKDLEHDSILKAMKLDHENALKTQRMGFDSSLRKRKLEQESSFKSQRDSLTEETAKSGEAKEVMEAKDVDSGKSQAAQHLEKKLQDPTPATNVAAETLNLTASKTLKSRKKLSGKKLRLQPAISTQQQQDLVLDAKAATSKQLDFVTKATSTFSKKKQLKHMEGDINPNDSKMDFAKVTTGYNADWQVSEVNVDDPYAF